MQCPGRRSAGAAGEVFHADACSNRATALSGQRGFGRAFRLLKPAEFSAVFSERQTLRGSWFILHYRENQLTTARLGLVVPKRHMPGAVQRNAIKRLAREVFRHQRLVLPSLDLVLRLAKAPAGRKKETLATLRAELESLFARLGALPRTS